MWNALLSTRQSPRFTAADTTTVTGHIRMRVLYVHGILQVKHVSVSDLGSTADLVPASSCVSAPTQIPNSTDNTAEAAQIYTACLISGSHGAQAGLDHLRLKPHTDKLTSQKYKKRKKAHLFHFNLKVQSTCTA